MCHDVFTSLSRNKIIEQNYTFMHRVYLTPVLHPLDVKEVKHVQGQSSIFSRIAEN